MVCAVHLGEILCNTYNNLYKIIPSIIIKKVNWAIVINVFIGSYFGNQCVYSCCDVCPLSIIDRYRGLTPVVVPDDAG